MRRIADLIGHPAHIQISCGCTRVLSAWPNWLMERLGPEATIEDGERRLICKDCGQRPKLRAQGDWRVCAGRDNRSDPPPMPSWVDLS